LGGSAIQGSLGGADTSLVSESAPPTGKPAAIPGARARRGPAALVCLWLIALVYTAHVTLGLGGAGNLALWDHWVYDTVMGAGALLCLARAVTGTERRVWGAIGAGMFLFWLGDLYWNNFLSSLAEPPYPSPADAAWLAFYPPVYFGVVSLIRSRADGLGPASWLDGLVGGLALASVAAMVVFEPILASSHGTFSTVATNLAYPALDVLLVAVAAGGLVVLGRRAGAALVLVGAGLLLFAVADSIYLIEAANNSYAENGWFNAGWPLAATLLATAAWLPPRQARQEPRREAGLSQYVLITLFAVMIVGVLAAELLVRGSAIAQVLVILAVIALLGRLALAVHEQGTLVRTRLEARTDELTKLPNRRALYEQLDRALGEGRALVLLLVDLNRFKEINDTLGHNAGDDLLCQVGERLQASLPEGGLLARIGGDEFVVLLEGHFDEATALRAGEVLRGAFDEPFPLEGLTIPVQASTGIGIAPLHADTRSEVLRCADVAMYRAKSRQTGVETYVAESDGHSRDYLALVSDLRIAVSSGQLLLDYQPKLSIEDGSFAGVEALVRWQHPRLGLLPPSEFVPMAEREGIMRSLTLCVLDLALAQQRRWREDGHEVPVAVNLSPASLLDTRLPEEVDAAISRHGARAGELELEITEETLMHDAGLALDVIARISERGVGFSLDDFGTGYSSLAQLKELPVRALKIDRSFISNMTANADDANIVRSTIELAHSLNLVVVAEGIETAEHLRRLMEFGCDVGQGFHIGRPMAPAEVPGWIAANTAGAPAREPAPR